MSDDDGGGMSGVLAAQEIQQWAAQAPAGKPAGPPPWWELPALLVAIVALTCVMSGCSAEKAVTGESDDANLEMRFGPAAYAGAESADTVLRAAMIPYEQIVERRRKFSIPGYATLAEVGFDWPVVTPYQKAARSETGPVLIGLHWIDAQSVEANRAVLEENGYLPKMAFNQILDIALTSAGMVRADLYVTQAFHLLPLHQRSESVPMSHIHASFDAITRHELTGRRVIALGDAAAAACRKHGVSLTNVFHPGARGRGLTHAEKGRVLAQVLVASR